MRLPLYVEFAGRKVLVVGGGGVGTSRAKKFLSAGAEVRVLSLAFSEELKGLEREGKIELVQGNASEEEVLEGQVRWCDLVVVAVGSLAVNVPVVELAKAHGRLVNLANDAEKTPIVVPFEGVVGGVRFAVTTEGGSGIVARKVRDRIEGMLKEDKLLPAQVEAMSHLKRYMKKTGVDVAMRMRLYFAVFEDEGFQKQLEKGRVKEAKKTAERLVADFLAGKRELKEARIDF